MPRVHYVKEARLSKFPRHCVTCGAEVLRFEAYRYAEPRVGPKLIWCYRHLPKRSQLSSSKLGPLWDLIDQFDAGAYETVDDLKSAVEEIHQQAEEIQSEYEDSLNNMPSQEGPVAENMQTAIDQLETYVGELDSIEYDGKTDDDVRPEIEIMVVREMLDEKGMDYEDWQISHPIHRGDLITAFLDYSVFETTVNERCEDALAGSLEELRGNVAELIASFEG